MNRHVPVITMLCLLGQSLAAWGYSWDKDMANQPSLKPQEVEAPPEPGSVPIEGGETLPAPQSAEEADEARDNAVSIPNPVPASAESIARGETFFQIHCAICHGEEGRGDGTVGVKFEEKAPADLTDPFVQDQADGQIFYTLTRGRNTMPYYRDSLSEKERWDVVNYLRHGLSTNERRANSTDR